MTPARASSYRSELIEGKQLPRKDQKRLKEEQRKFEAEKYTIDRLWRAYRDTRPAGKNINIDTSRYEKYLKPEFGNKTPQEIIRLDVERLKRHLLKGLAPQTVKHILNLLTWIVNYGANNGLCQGLQFQIPKPNVNNQTTEDLTPDQLINLFQALKDASNIQVANLMRLALYTGMRRGELFKLKWQDIDLLRRFITIRDPKGGKDSIIPINDSANEVLESHPKTQSPYVFPDKNGGMRKDIHRAVNKIKKAAGLPDDFRPLHGLRHTFASMLASSGEVDMYTLQKLMTHKSPVMTQRYAHLRDESLKKAGKVAGDYFKRFEDASSSEGESAEKQKNGLPG